MFVVLLSICHYKRATQKQASSGGNSSDDSSADGAGETDEKDEGDDQDHGQQSQVRQGVLAATTAGLPSVHEVHICDFCGASSDKARFSFGFAD